MLWEGQFVLLVSTLTPMKVLIIDADPQANASSGLGFDPNDNDHSLYHVFSESIKISDVIKKTFNPPYDL